MNPLFFKESIVDGNDLDLFFHKDYPYNYNPEEFPVVKYSLINCRDINNYKLATYADDNDGVFIDVKVENEKNKFILTDVSGTTITIVCDKVLNQHIKYREEDFVHLIKEILKQRDEATDSNTKSLDILFEVKYFIEEEVISVGKKISEAQWLPEEKKQFLEGQKNILHKILDIINPSNE
jgi:hypothetical protein